VIDALTGQGIDVQHACRTLGVSPSGYYAWKDRPASPRELRRIWLAGEIADVHKASGGTYGALRVTAELRHGRDIVVGHNAVSAIMRQLGLKGLPTRRLPKGARVGKVGSRWSSSSRSGAIASARASRRIRAGPSVTGAAIRECVPQQARADSTDRWQASAQRDHVADGAVLEP